MPSGFPSDGRAASITSSEKPGISSALRRGFRHLATCVPTSAFELSPAPIPGAHSTPAPPAFYYRPDKSSASGSPAMAWRGNHVAAYPVILQTRSNFGRIMCEQTNWREKRPGSSVPGRLETVDDVRHRPNHFVGALLTLRRCHPDRPYQSGRSPDNRAPSSGGFG